MGKNDVTHGLADFSRGIARSKSKDLEVAVAGLDSNAFEAEKVIAWISPNAKMPVVPIQLTLKPGFSLVALSYSARIDYKDHGRNDTTGLRTGSPNKLSFTINFGASPQGGAFVIDMPVKIKRNSDGAIASRTISGSSNVRGRQPSKSNVKAALSNIELKVTAYRESRFRQFTNAGKPLFGPPHGFGVMQIDNPPATARQIWDWKDNVRAGIALFNQKKEDARTYPARVRKNHPTATDFTPAQLKLETYQRYNGGGYWQWDPESSKWKKRSQMDTPTSPFELRSWWLPGNRRQAGTDPAPLQTGRRSSP